MINNLRLLRNLGTFDNVSTGAGLPFGRLTTIYAENGRGKTTLAAVFRSIATGDRIPVVERHRLGAEHPPYVRVTCDGGDAVFESDAWNRTLPEVTVFDDAFVDENVHSGLAVDPDHRQRLHELILGAQGIALNKRHQELIAQNEVLNSAKRAREQAIPPAIRGPFTVEQFCGLQAEPRIDVLAQDATRSLEAARAQDLIRQNPLFAVLSLPEFDVAGIERLLAQNLPALDAEAAERVQNHLARLGAGGENWVADGMRRVPSADSAAEEPCPFCAQALGGSPVIDHYRAYFSAGYSGLKRDVSDMQQAIARVHGGDAQAGFERSMRIASATWVFWARYADVHAIVLEDGHGEILETETVTRDWSTARDHVLAALQAKQAAPLDAAALSDAAKEAIRIYTQHRESVATLNDELQQTSNDRIRSAKAEAAVRNIAQLAGDLARLQAVRARQEEANRALCAAYTQVAQAKVRNEQERDAARAALEGYRTAAFPAIQDAVNAYLERFGAGYRLVNVEPVNSRSGSACNYSLLINDRPVSVAGGQPNAGEPSFKNTLSSGDRNTLTLAFFLASIDRDPNMATRIVVIDDPFSSFDDHRATTTIQEIRRLAGRVAQVIVLSHNKRFLASLWDQSDEAIRASLRVNRDGAGSTLTGWDVSADEYNEHDRCHELLRTYTGAPGEAHPVAQGLRTVLEGFLRAAYPEGYPPGTLLGNFVTMCQQRLGSGNPILSEADTQELRDLNEYSRQFHHGTNPAYNINAQINDGELAGFVARTLRFARRP